MLDRRQRQRRTAGLAELLAQATGGLLARGSGGEDRLLESQGYQPVLYSPLLPASAESLADGIVVEPGVPEELAPPRVMAGPLDPEVDGAPHRPRGIAADVVAEQVMREQQVPGLAGHLLGLGQPDRRV